MDINGIINTVSEYLPVVGAVSVGVLVAIIAILKKVAEKKGAENTKADEVAASLEKAKAYVEDLTDGHPDIDPDNGK